MSELAEVKALREHVAAISKMLFEDRGFVTASETKLRLSQADALIARGENDQSDEWLAEATEMAKKLRAECGTMQLPVK